MSVIWALIVFAGIGVWLCARSRAAMPAVFFTAVAVVLFLYTAQGQDLLNLATHVHLSAASGSAGGSR
jgi:hypothetical protein